MDVRAFGSWTSAPKCLFSKDFEGLTEVLAPGRPPGYPRGRPPGYPTPKLTLWVDFPFLSFSTYHETAHNSAFPAQSIANPPRELQESLGPEIQKSLEKSPEQTFSRLFQTFSGFFKTFSRPFEALGSEAAGDFFRTFLGFRARRARDSCSSREGSQPKQILPTIS